MTQKLIAVLKNFQAMYRFVGDLLKPDAVKSMVEWAEFIYNFLMY